MFRSYFTIAYRNLIKNRIYTLVNIFGLAIGLAACFFIFQYVHFESSYDGFNKNLANIYRVNISFGGSFSNLPPMSTNHPAVGPAMKAAFPEVVDYARVVSPVIFMAASNISYTNTKGNAVIFNPGKLYFADASFLTMFSFPFVSGDPSTALIGARTAVISKKLAEKYFGKEDPMGKTLLLNQNLPLKVTGVFKDVPENSHIKFDMLISFSTLGSDRVDSWTWPEFYNYVMLAPGTDPKKVEARFPTFINTHLGKIMKDYNFVTYFHLQPLVDIHLRSEGLKGPEDNGSDKEVYFLTVIGIFILVIAWINYINLSTAKSMERAKEVGLRKVVGALRWQLIGQFIIESVLINLLALILAAAIVYICFPYFGAFIGKDISAGSASSGLWHASGFWLSLVTIFLTGALLVGAYPAFILSAYKPVLVLKGRFFQSGKGILLRKVLVSFQFVLSLLLIAGTVTVYRQLSFMRNQSLGYNKDEVLVVKVPPHYDTTYEYKLRSFQAQVLRQPSISDVALSTEIPGKTVVARNSIRKATDDQTHNFVTNIVEVDDHFISTYQMELAAGRNFTFHDTSSDYQHDKTKVIVNEEVVKGLGFKNNEAALHQYVTLTEIGDNHAEIIGVLSDYHQRSLREGYDPMIYLYPSRTNWTYFSIHVHAGHISDGMSAIEDSYESIFGGTPFEYFFLNEFFDRQYQSDQRFGKVFSLFTILTIIVACLGLLGLSSFVVRLRVKEIGIRKVLGASVYSILVLFSKDFVVLVAIASAIALPVIYFLVHLWLSNYAFHIPVDGFLFIAPPLILLIISLITIGLQSFKTALANPVKSIRSE
jgi:putative ABC transport system permease protein